MDRVKFRSHDGSAGTVAFWLHAMDARLRVRTIFSEFWKFRDRFAISVPSNNGISCPFTSFQPIWFMFWISRGLNDQGCCFSGSFKIEFWFLTFWQDDALRQSILLFGSGSGLNWLNCLCTFWQTRSCWWLRRIFGVPANMQLLHLLR